jgi:hypothetical protein
VNLKAAPPEVNFEVVGRLSKEHLGSAGGLVEE